MTTLDVGGVVLAVDVVVGVPSVVLLGVEAGAVTVAWRVLGLVLVGFTVIFVVATGALDVEPGTGDVPFPAGVAEVAFSVFPLLVVPAAVLSTAAVLGPVSFFVLLSTFVAVEAFGLAVVVELPVLVSAGDVCPLVGLAG